MSGHNLYAFISDGCERVNWFCVPYFDDFTDLVFCRYFAKRSADEFTMEDVKKYEQRNAIGLDK